MPQASNPMFMPKQPAIQAKAPVIPVKRRLDSVPSSQVGALAAKAIPKETNMQWPNKKFKIPRGMMLVPAQGMEDEEMEIECMS